MKRGPKEHNAAGLFLSHYREAETEIKHCTILLQTMPDDCNLLERILIAETVIKKIRAALDFLDDDERRLIESVYIGGKSFETAAEAVPCSARTARRMKRRCFEKIEKQLTD